MLDLVLPHRHLLGPIEQDVGRLEHRVHQQARRHALHPLRLVLELGHPLQRADPHHVGEEPLQPGMLRNVRLHEHDRLLRVDPRRQQPDDHLPRALGQHGRIVPHGEDVEVHRAVETLVAVLQLGPVLYRTEPIADVELASRLNPREYPIHVRSG
ncbi:MAG: hypothetical protein R2909_13490 [Gemmatimonadales bacterium]